jgi:universal stress protein E
MRSIRRILVAVRALDATSLPAVLKAGQLARAWRASLEIYHCLDAPLFADLPTLGAHKLHDVERNLHQHALQQLQGLADRARLHDVKVAVRAEWDFPAYEAIVRRAVRIKADLVIASAHAGPHWLPSLMRLTDWELVRLSPMPLLLIKDARPYRRPVVLAALDPTHSFAKPLKLDRQILQLASAVSQKLRGSLHAVHAYTRVPGDSFPAEAITPAIVGKIERDAQRAARVAFERVLKSSRIAPAHRYLIARDPVSAIADTARRSRSAIVVMGAISRSGIKRWLIGNTAERILDDLRCDVLIVKPTTFRNRVPRATRGVHLLTAPMPGAFGYY